jgi:enamine deaminase RidA (YjgF/YER057c/UK114 family)
MYACLAAAGNPQLVRVWNYIPEINLHTHGLERYRQFNTARHQASLACGRAVAGRVPAASALGAAPGSPVTIYFLASQRAPGFIENPRQVSAYRYPAQYGPRSPAFSRATLLGEGEEATLFISGTASIVGHRTMHAGDPAAQTRETLVNIEALLEEAGRRTGTRPLRLESLAYKVYVRNPRELPVIRAELEAAVGSKAALLYLKADICRRDLAVEIEAVGGHGWRPED